MKILKEMHPEVNFEKEQNLVGDMILDSFDLVSLISEVEEAYEVRISQKITEKWMRSHSSTHPLSVSCAFNLTG